MDIVSENRCVAVEIALLLCNVVLLAMLVSWWSKRRREQAELQRYRIGG